MKIGVDIDGTINNLDVVLRKLLFEQFEIIVDKNQYDVFKELSEHEFHIFEVKNHDNLIYNVKMLPFAKATLKKLAETHDIIFVTARKNNAKISTLKWFDFHDFDISLASKICFGSHDKAKVCQENDVDIMIEDCPHHLINLAQNHIPTLKMNHKYNESVYSDYAADSWKEIYKIISYLIT